MDKKEYRENRKEIKKSFKKYRKHMKKIIFGVILALASMFILPEYVFSPLNTLLQQFFSSYVAGSITFGIQVILASIGATTAIISGMEANKERDKIENAQYDEECMIENIISQNEELLGKVKEYENQKVNTISNRKTNTTSSSIRKSTGTIDTGKTKVKKYV